MEEKTADTKCVNEQVISWGLVPQPWEMGWDRQTEGTGRWSIYAPSAVSPIGEAEMKAACQA